MGKVMYWFSQYFDTLSTCMSMCMIIVSVINLVVLLLYVNAPYGRYSDTYWGWPVHGKLAWFLQEIPSLTVPAVLLYYADNTDATNIIFCIMFCIHYVQRALIFPFLIRGGKPTPFVPFFLAVVFCFYNGLLQAISLLYITKYPSDWFTRPHVPIGIAFFVAGMLINIHSDHILRNLRKPGETGYKIPKGGMFEYVSGANFFGEILEWCGFAIACSSLASFAFALFTVSNLGPRAVSHHKWYKQKFENYPTSRKVIIPFIL